MRWVPVLAAIVVATSAQAQSFSCGIGKQAACLDYGDKVCSSYAKCVDQNAACFDQYQCDFGGFTCKSYVSDCADNLSDIAGKYDDVVYKNNELRELIKELTARIDELEFCLSLADDLEDAQSCTY